MNSYETETARDLFWKALSSGSIMPGNPESLPILESAANEWRNAGLYFSAGYVMLKAADVTWGEREKWQNYIKEASKDFQRCVDAASSPPFERLAALFKWSSVLHRLIWFSTDASVKQTIRQLSESLAQQLLRDYRDSPYAENFLVKGFTLTTNLEGEWEPSFHNFEVTYGIESWGNKTVIINLPSAFHLFIRFADYESADALIELCPQAFSTPGLKGWMYAVQGFLRPSEAPEKFAEAANVFSTDLCPLTDEELRERGGSWSSINIDLWAKYFNSKSVLASIIHEPDRAKELIRKAASLMEGPRSENHTTSRSIFYPRIRPDTTWTNRIWKRRGRPL